MAYSNPLNALRGFEASQGIMSGPSIQAWNASPKLGAGTNGSSWGSLGGIMQGMSGIMTGLTGIGQLYNAYEANQLAKKQFAFEQAAYATNLKNQAKMINNQYDAAANISAQIGAGTPGDSLATSQAITDYKKNAKNQHVASSIS